MGDTTDTIAVQYRSALKKKEVFFTLSIFHLTHNPKLLSHSHHLLVIHFETARAYGTSELQLGDALGNLIEEGYCKRSDLIIQTKIGTCKTQAEFKKK